MTSRLTGTAKWSTRIFALMAGASTLFFLAPAAPAQDPIRVQTNQVLVPVWVIDKERDRLLRRNASNLWRAVNEGNVQLQENIVESIMIRDLTAGDFQVFEDGKDQAIQSVTFELSPYYDFRDNRGHHSEYFGEVGGKWSSREWPPWLVGDLSYPHYLIGYAQPESREGSCHQIKIKANRRNAVVVTRTEYCNTLHSALDTLNGTKLGRQMEADLASAKDGKVGVSLLAIALYSEGEAGRVHIAIDWPWKSLIGNSKTLGILRVIFKKDGSLAARFSELNKYNSTDENSSGPHWEHIWTRYETQLILPPDDYDVRVVLSDGRNFGRAETRLAVHAFDRKELTISAVSLCKQIQDASAYSSLNLPRLPGTWTAKLPAGYLPLVSQDIEFKPTGDTRFKKGDTLYTYFELYEPSLVEGPSTTVEIQVRIVDLKTGEAMTDPQPISALPYVKAEGPTIPIGRGIDIRKLPKGSYRLDVQAKGSAGKSTAWQSANFTVE